MLPVMTLIHQAQPILIILACGGQFIGDGPDGSRLT